MEKLRELGASWQIFHSNFNAKYGAVFNLIVLLLIAAAVAAVLIRAALAGRKSRIAPSPLASRTPDKERTDHAAESLAMAIRCPSITGREEEMLAIGRLLKERYPLAAKTLDWATLPGGSLLLRWRAEDPGENEPVLLCSHLDVVPGGEGWSVCDPFDGIRQGGRIYGRGAADCKAAVVAMLEATETLLAEGVTPRRDVYYAFGCDGEAGGRKGAARIAKIMEKEGLQFSLVLDEGGTFRETMPDGRRYYPAAYIGMGEKRLCEYRLTAACEGGRSAVPGRTTALGVLSEAICRVESAQPHHHLLPIVRRQINATMSGFSFGKRLVLTSPLLREVFVGKLFRNEPALSALVRSTVVPTRVDGGFTAGHVLPATASVLLNARLLPGEDPERELEQLRALTADLPVEAELISAGDESFLTSENQPMYKLLKSTIEGLYPTLPCIATLTPTAEDARHYSALSDCILRFSPLTLGPEGGGKAHGADENLSEKALGLAVEIYEGLLRKL